MPKRFLCFAASQNAFTSSRKHFFMRMCVRIRVLLSLQESLTMFDFNLERAASYLVEQQQRAAAVTPQTAGDSCSAA